MSKKYAVLSAFVFLISFSLAQAQVQFVDNGQMDKELIIPALRANMSASDLKDLYSYCTSKLTENRDIYNTWYNTVYLTDPRYEGMLPSQAIVGYPAQIAQLTMGNLTFTCPEIQKEIDSKLVPVAPHASVSLPKKTPAVSSVPDTSPVINPSYPANSLANNPFTPTDIQDIQNAIDVTILREHQNILIAIVGLEFLIITWLLYSIFTRNRK